MRPIHSPVSSLLSRFALVCLIVGVGLPTEGRAQEGLPTYRIENLDTGQFSEPSAVLPAGGFLGPPVHISDNGQYVVVRVYDNRDPIELPRHVARLDRQTGTAELIPAFSGSPFTLGVNNLGDVLVVMNLAVTPLQFWSTATGVIGFPGGVERLIGSNGEATGRLLNNAGQVLVGPDDFWLWDPVADTVIQILNDDPTFPGQFEAMSLNDAGQVVGQVVRDPDPAWPGNQEDRRAFIWDAAAGMRVLPDPGFMTPNVSPFVTFGRRVFANAINADGVIGGAVRDDQGELFAAVWENETVLPDLIPCTGPNQALVPACSVWRIGGGGDVLGGFGSDSVQANILWDDANDPYLLAGLVENGPEPCLADAVAVDGTLSGTCENTLAALLIPVGGGPGDSAAPAISDLVADPNPVAIGDPVDLMAWVDDSQSGGSTISGASYTVDGGPPVTMSAADGVFDSAVEEVVAEAPGFGASGIFEICATAEDSAGNVTEPACVLVAVYDPAAGFVTGGGWIDSPAGALANSESAGKASFGFVVRYKRGASVPMGSTEFQFHQPGLNFHSADYDWLVITAWNQTAQFHGTGTLNGASSPNGSPYRFTVEAEDGQPDAFRLRIWWTDAGAEVIVYDSGSTDLGGGSIVVHF